MKQGSEFTGSYSHSFKFRFNATNGRTVRRAAERKRRKEAKRQLKLEGGK